MVWGVVTSREQRTIDRRYYAAFIGFTAEVIAVIATSLVFVVADLQPHSMNPAVQGFGFVTSIIAVLSIAITFFAGLITDRRHRHLYRRIWGGNVDDVVPHCVEHQFAH